MIFTQRRSLDRWLLPGWRIDGGEGVLPPELATEPGYEQRFRREAYTAARLTEPHIIPIHEAGEIEGRLYLVMPVIDGIDVHGVLQRDGPMSPQRAVSVIGQLAAALDAAHAVGLVHRDVKPSNALVTGAPRVMFCRRRERSMVDSGSWYRSAGGRLNRPRSAGRGLGARATSAGCAGRWRQTP
jgi:Protein kinase domain